MSRTHEQWTADCTAVTDSELSEWGTPLPLKKFINEIRKIFPKCSFSQRGENSQTRLRQDVHASPLGSNVYQQPHSFWVYHAYKPLCMGWVSLHIRPYDQKNGKNNKPQYIVYSKRISNEKYASYNWKHHSVSSVNLKVALRNVRKYLRDYSAVEVASKESNECRRGWSNTDEAMRKKLSNARRNVTVDDGGNDPLLRELLSVENSDYNFIDPEFGQKVTEFLDAHREHKERLEGRTKRMLLVSVEKDFHGNDLYCTALTDDISEWKTQWVEGERYNSENIPEALMGKLSVLSMGKNGQYFDNVGYRATETCFYVVQEDV